MWLREENKYAQVHIQMVTTLFPVNCVGRDHSLPALLIQFAEPVLSPQCPWTGKALQPPPIPQPCSSGPRPQVLWALVRATAQQKLLSAVGVINETGNVMQTNLLTNQAWSASSFLLKEEIPVSTDNHQLQQNLELGTQNCPEIDHSVLLELAWPKSWPGFVHGRITEKGHHQLYVCHTNWKAKHSSHGR